MSLPDKATWKPRARRSAAWGVPAAVAIVAASFTFYERLGLLVPGAHAPDVLLVLLLFAQDLFIGFALLLGVRSFAEWMVGDVSFGRTWYQQAERVITGALLIAVGLGLVQWALGN